MVTKAASKWRDTVEIGDILNHLEKIENPSIEQIRSAGEEISKRLKEKESCKGFSHIEAFSTATNMEQFESMIEELYDYGDSVRVLIKAF